MGSASSYRNCNGVIKVTNPSINGRVAMFWQIEQLHR
jgi:hypothetical protein